MKLDRKMVSLALLFSLGLLVACIFIQFSWHGSPGLMSIIQVWNDGIRGGDIPGIQVAVNIVWLSITFINATLMLVMLAILVHGSK